MGPGAVIPCHFLGAVSKESFCPILGVGLALNSSKQVNYSRGFKAAASLILDKIPFLETTPNSPKYFNIPR
jgi:hypothetical protein